jgi:hypothetical protein
MGGKMKLSVTTTKTQKPQRYLTLFSGVSKISKEKFVHELLGVCHATAIHPLNRLSDFKAHAVLIKLLYALLFVACFTTALSAKIVSCTNINEYLRNYQDCLTLDCSI